MLEPWRCCRGGCRCRGVSANPPPPAPHPPPPPPPPPHPRPRPAGIVAQHNAQPGSPLEQLSAHLADPWKNHFINNGVSLPFINEGCGPGGGGRGMWRFWLGAACPAFAVYLQRNGTAVCCVFRTYMNRGVVGSPQRPTCTAVALWQPPDAPAGPMTELPLLTQAPCLPPTFIAACTTFLEARVSWDSKKIDNNSVVGARASDSHVGGGLWRRCAPAAQADRHSTPAIPPTFCSLSVFRMAA